MRPAGELREAIAKAAAELVPQPDAPGVPWRMLVRHAKVGELMGRRTVENMQRTGALRITGQATLPGVCRPVNLYAPPAPGPAAEPMAVLQDAMRSWASAA